MAELKSRFLFQFKQFRPPDFVTHVKASHVNKRKEFKWLTQYAYRFERAIASERDAVFNTKSY